MTFPPRLSLRAAQVGGPSSRTPDPPQALTHLPVPVRGRQSPRVPTQPAAGFVCSVLGTRGSEGSLLEQGAPGFGADAPLGSPGQISALEWTPTPATVRGLGGVAPPACPPSPPPPSRVPQTLEGHHGLEGSAAGGASAVPAAVPTPPTCLGLAPGALCLPAEARVPKTSQGTHANSSPPPLPQGTPQTVCAATTRKPSMTTHPAAVALASLAHP